MQLYGAINETSFNVWNLSFEVSTITSTMMQTICKMIAKCILASNSFTFWSWNKLCILNEPKLEWYYRLTENGWNAIPTLSHSTAPSTTNYLKAIMMELNAPNRDFSISYYNGCFLWFYSVDFCVFRFVWFRFDSRLYMIFQIVRAF